MQERFRLFNSVSEQGFGLDDMLLASSSDSRLQQRLRDAPVRHDPVAPREEWLGEPQESHGHELCGTELFPVAAVSALSNVGPGLGAVIGPSGNFAALPDASKWLLCFGMLLGRLELFTVLILLLPQFWRG